MARMHLSFPLTLPYFRPSEELPSPLPSVAEIRASQRILPTRRKNRRIVLVGDHDHYVAKYGRNLDMIEGENLLLVNQSCNISVPQVFALFHDDETDSNYIIMEFIPGQSLASLWNSLGDASKNDIALKLRKTFNELRQLPVNDYYYGKLGRRPYFDEIFMSLEPDTHKQICGPFATEREIVDAIVYRYTSESQFPQRGEYLRRVLPMILRSDGPVFTHGDFQRKNVLIRGDGTLVVIDWEAAAFYPKYYEYYSAMVAFGHYRDDWHMWVGRILDEYVAESVWLDTIRRELM